MTDSCFCNEFRIPDIEDDLFSFAKPNYCLNNKLSDRFIASSGNSG